VTAIGVQWFRAQFADVRANCYRLLSGLRREYTLSETGSRSGLSGATGSAQSPSGRPDRLTSIFVSAYVSSPELTFGFLFALEDPERIAEVVRTLIVRKTVSVFRLARLSDDDGPPERYVVNWATIPQISITTVAPDADTLRANNTMLVNAFLGEDGEVSLYSANGETSA